MRRIQKLAKSRLATAAATADDGPREVIVDGRPFVAVGSGPSFVLLPPLGEEDRPYQPAEATP